MAAGTGSQRRGWWIALAGLFCLGVAAPSAREFRTIEVEALRVTIDSDWVPRSSSGYLPIRFDITNLGDARVIEIVVVQIEIE